MKKEVRTIIEIGEQGKCRFEDLLCFSPNYPRYRGSEFIKSVGYKDLRFRSENEIEYFVKGLHYVELKYREMTNCDFGFGSPSRTYPIIRSLEKIDRFKELGGYLKEWIRENGGNYHIKPPKPDSVVDNGLLGDII